MIRFPARKRRRLGITGMSLERLVFTARRRTEQLRLRSTDVSEGEDGGAGRKIGSHARAASRNARTRCAPTMLPFRSYSSRASAASCAPAMPCRRSASASASRASAANSGNSSTVGSSIARRANVSARRGYLK